MANEVDPGVGAIQDSAVALIHIGVKVAKVLKAAKADGKIDVADLPAAYAAIFGDPAFIAEVEKALGEVKDVGPEIAAMNLPKGLQLATVLIPAALQGLKDANA